MLGAYSTLCEQMSHSHVQELIRSVGFGTTEPLIALLRSNGMQFEAVVKLKNNPQSVLAVVNELLAYKLATACGVPMPLSGVAIIDCETKLNGLADADAFGTCFYSSYVNPSSTVKPRILEKIDNKECYERIMLFDFIVNNRDRHKNNLIVSLSSASKRLYTIDHTHAFKNGTIWDRYCLVKGMRDNDYKDEDIALQTGYDALFETKSITLESLRSASTMMKQQLDCRLVKKATEELPTDWPIAKDDIDALVNYLLYRIKHLDDYCEILAKARGLD